MPSPKWMLVLVATRSVSSQYVITDHVSSGWPHQRATWPSPAFNTAMPYLQTNVWSLLLHLMVSSCIHNLWVIAFTNPLLFISALRTNSWYKDITPFWSFQYFVSLPIFLNNPCTHSCGNFSSYLSPFWCWKCNSNTSYWLKMLCWWLKVSQISWKWALSKVSGSWPSTTWIELERSVVWQLAMAVRWACLPSNLLQISTPVPILGCVICIGLTMFKKWKHQTHSTLFQIVHLISTSNLGQYHAVRSSAHLK